MGAKADLLQIYNAAMNLSGQPLYGFLPSAQLACSASFTAATTTIVLAAAVPSWVVNGMNVYDVTNSQQIGTVNTLTTNTITLSANAAHAAAGATDVLQFGFTPADLAAGEAAGRDINGAIQIATLKCQEAIQVLTDLKNDVITSALDTPANTLIAAAITALS